jgi:hypothetical protein
MSNGPYMGKVRSQNSPWYSWRYGMTHVVAALSFQTPASIPTPGHHIPHPHRHVLSHFPSHIASSSFRSLYQVVRSVSVRRDFLSCSGWLNLHSVMPVISSFHTEDMRLIKEMRSRTAALMQLPQDFPYHLDCISKYPKGQINPGQRQCKTL